MIVVYMTNQKIAEIKAQSPETILSNTRCCFLHPTNSAEVLAFIGLVYLSGLLGQAKHNLNILFKSQTGSPISGATVNKNRFKILVLHVSFDNLRTRAHGWAFDRFAEF